jgi:hypothetical protein
MSDDFDGEPIPGLPQRPPAGERILWQGSPDWRATALRTFHVGWVAGYFAALLGWGIVAAMLDGATLAHAAAGLAYLVPIAALVVAVLAVLSRVVSRSTVYTITTQRVVMRFGIALPMAVNFPFRLVGGAAVKAWADGTGNIPLQLRSGTRVGYVVMWPHVRPWRLASPQPMLRGVADVHQVAAILARALLEADPARATQARVSLPAEARDDARGGPSINRASAAA